MKLKHNLNRSQRLGLDIDKHVAIAAGAGTGKTTVMALRYIEHLLNDVQRATTLLPQSPRRPVHGPGSLRTPKREQIDLEEWRGLLPSECVAITFTNEAADELRHRIRALLFEKQQDEDDPRINRKGLIEQMLSLLDEAPIGTIDSFFSSLLKPWMGLVNETPTKENVSDEARPLLSKLAIKSAWRIRNENDAFEAGITSEHSKFIKARNRLSTGLGGRYIAEKMLNELLKQSLFVEESESKIKKLSLGVGEKSEAIKDYIQQMILSISRPGLKRIDELYNLALDWLNGCINFGNELDLADALIENSRYAAYDDLVRSGIPSDDWEKLQWLSHFEYIITTEKSYLEMKSKSSAMPKGMLPNHHTEKWPSGIKSVSAVKGKKNNDRAKKEIVTVGKKISALLNEHAFSQLRRMGYCAWLFHPTLAFPQHPEGVLRGSELVSFPLNVNLPEKSLIASIPLQINLLEDLFTVQHGIHSILKKIKLTREMHDYSDIQRLAEDLLLARCPDICRTWYPEGVIDLLDNLPLNPWEDIHIEKALSLASENADVYTDLENRLEIVKSLRRRFRTFIIDEYQDTNPQQFRLLCRLFGRRKLESSEPRPPESPWDPTICVVGDLKQSIFRFRQAQVTVMLNTIEMIREINTIEMNSEQRLIDLREKQGVSKGFGRDPRPILSKTKSNQFVTGDVLEEKLEGSNENLLTYSLGDNDEILDYNIQTEREQGYLKLSMNYRTDGNLLLTLNEIFEDLFSEEHDYISGNWHARAQSLIPSKDLKNEQGKLEWIIPVNQKNKDEDKNNLIIPLDPFVENNDSKSFEREHELLAARLHALIHGTDCKVLGTDDENKWLKIPSDEKLEPEDIMILVQKRKHIPDLMERLNNWGIPAIVDRQEGLLKQPIVQALYNLLNAAVNPHNPTLMSALLRSELVCFNDKQLHTLIKKVNNDENIFQLLIESVEEGPNKNMYARWNLLSHNREFITLLEDTLDFSDILSIYPSSEARQLAEQFISIVSVIYSQVGGSGTLLMSALEDLREEGGELPAKTLPLSGAIRVMTIHAAKGLQCKVVVLCGLFNDAHHSLTTTIRNRLVVTPELMASQLKPWSSKEGIQSGMWQFSKFLIQSQIQAEYRRLLYVALTRVEKHLILVGGNNNSIAKISETNNIVMKLPNQENPTLGEMIFSGIASNSVNTEDNPWVKPGNTLTLQPSELFQNSYFQNGLKSLTIFHSLDCFSNEIGKTTPFSKLETEQNLLNSKILEFQNFENKLSRSVALRLAPHKLDAAGSCKRRHWLSTSLGLDSESLLPYIKTETNVQNKFPNPADFGTIFHRLVEVGIGNPAISNNFDLPLTWKRKQNSKLLDNNVVSEIINELLPIDADEKVTKERLEILSKLFEHGPLGKLCSGKKVGGYSIDGLLTEMPFECTISLKSEGIELELWTPYGSRKTSEIDQTSISFSGRIDLVLALSDESNNRFLMAVDIKTEGSLYGFNQYDSLNGTPLQIPVEEIENRFKLNSSEKETLENHSFQLALYNHVLDSIQKNSKDGRKILPPSIYVAASGRLISWNDSEQEIKQQNLKELLNWIAKSSMNQIKPDEIRRQPPEKSEICTKCPYNSGPIKLCGPLESEIGLIENPLDNAN
ncbi:MAG TPA: UvrD-helicase domain-containing protein [Candidatus Poseidoniaceae archaeon]|nr:UvrD-helicase domain-containing protein [Candidatus Poseidoniaceae archaeon]